MKVNKDGTIASLGHESSPQETEKAKKTIAPKNLDKTKYAETSKPTDYEVNLSQGSKELKQAYEKAFSVAKNTPEVREEKVRELKEKISKGLYRIDSGAVADGILKEAIKDHLATRE